MTELSTEKFEKFITKVKNNNFLRLELIVPIIKKYGIDKAECMLSYEIFNAEDVNTTKEMVNIFSIGLSKELNTILGMLSEMIDEGVIEIKSVLYAFSMGYDYTFTLNLILQFPHILKVMSKYKVEKISDKIHHKNMYTFFSECNEDIAAKSAKRIEQKDQEFFNELKRMEVKLAYII